MHAARLTQVRVRRVQHSVAFYTHIGTDRQLVCSQGHTAFSVITFRFVLLYLGCSIRSFRSIPFHSVKYTRPLQVQNCVLHVVSTSAQLCTLYCLHKCRIVCFVLSLQAWNCVLCSFCSSCFVVFILCQFLQRWSHMYYYV